MVVKQTPNVMNYSLTDTLRALLVLYTLFPSHQVLKDALGTLSEI
jgi:hypothetical protein